MIHEKIRTMKMSQIMPGRAHEAWACNIEFKNSHYLGRNLS